MRITRSDQQHLIVLSNDESTALMEACALVVTAVHSPSGPEPPASDANRALPAVHRTAFLQQAAPQRPGVI